VKLVYLVGFITKKFVTMHGHMDLKFCQQQFMYFTPFSTVPLGSQ